MHHVWDNGDLVELWLDRGSKFWKNWTQPVVVSEAVCVKENSPPLPYPLDPSLSRSVVNGDFPGTHVWGMLGGLLQDPAADPTVKPPGITLWVISPQAAAGYFVANPFNLRGG